MQHARLSEVSLEPVAVSNRHHVIAAAGSSPFLC